MVREIPVYKRNKERQLSPKISRLRHVPRSSYFLTRSRTHRGFIPRGLQIQTAMNPRRLVNYFVYNVRKTIRYSQEYRLLG